jgi:hypothetical protein
VLIVDLSGKSRAADLHAVGDKPEKRRFTKIIWTVQQLRCRHRILKSATTRRTHDLPCAESSRLTNRED